MARFEVTSNLDALFDEVARMGEASGEVADRMLTAAAEEVKRSWKATAESFKLRDTGAMIESIGYPRGVTNAADVKCVDIYPQGKDAHGVRNAEKAFLLHYGWSSHPATHWIDVADEASAEPVERVMLEIWDAFIEGRS